MRVAVELWPAGAGRVPRALPGASVVIIDVLRATTTLTVAVTHGATRILPFASPEAALRHRESDPASRACGERDGRMVSGFDLGNSPAEYTRERVAGRTLAFASTNGSLAMRAVSRCRRRVLAAFVNAAAVVEALAGESQVLVLCAGRLGRFSIEDAACAGLLVERWAVRGATLDGDGARLARQLAPRDAAAVQALVEGASHGRYLRSLGPVFAADVESCARLDQLATVAEVRDADLSAAGPATS